MNKNIPMKEKKIFLMVKRENTIIGKNNKFHKGDLLKEKLALLYENIDEKEVVEYIKSLEFNSTMLECDIRYEYRPLSYFSMEITTSNKENLIVLNFYINHKKKYLIKIDLTHKYNRTKYWYDSEKLISSSIIVPNFMFPLKTAMNILINC